ncbi:Iron-containing alcohol dehydrogenase domain containing protein [Naviculisporaceae sp. PSN 640]
MRPVQQNSKPPSTEPGKETSRSRKMTLPGEDYFLVMKPKPHVSLGAPFEAARKHHAVETFGGATRIYIVVSKSISRTNNFVALQEALGNGVIGVRYGIRQHVPWPGVLAVATELRELDADLIITLGAGSLTDAAKVAAFAVANGAFTLDDLDKLHIRSKPDSDSLKACTIPIIDIPTWLSGGEYNPAGGATDVRNSRKTSFKHPTMGAQLVILDPALTVSTPETVWLASGMRSVDHCVEGLCALYSQPGGDGEENQSEVERYLAEGDGGAAGLGVRAADGSKPRNRASIGTDGSRTWRDKLRDAALGVEVESRAWGYVGRSATEPGAGGLSGGPDICRCAGAEGSIAERVKRRRPCWCICRRIGVADEPRTSRNWKRSLGRVGDELNDGSKHSHKPCTYHKKRNRFWKFRRWPGKTSALLLLLVGSNQN